MKDSNRRLRRKMVGLFLQDVPSLGLSLYTLYYTNLGNKKVNTIWVILINMLLTMMMIGQGLKELLWAKSRFALYHSLGVEEQMNRVILHEEPLTILITEIRKVEAELSIKAAKSNWSISAMLCNGGEPTLPSDAPSAILSEEVGSAPPPGHRRQSPATTM